MVGSISPEMVHIGGPDGRGSSSVVLGLVCDLRHILLKFSALPLELSARRYLPLGFDLVGRYVGGSRCGKVPFGAQTWEEILSR